MDDPQPAYNVADFGASILNSVCSLRDETFEDANRM
jgi:hypothetical protein